MPTVAWVPCVHHFFDHVCLLVEDSDDLPYMCCLPAVAFLVQVFIKFNSTIER